MTNFRPGSAITLVSGVAVAALVVALVTPASSAASATSLPSIDAGSLHSCGVKTDAAVVCWGDNGDGRATAPPGSFSSVSAGDSHSCAVRSDATLALLGFEQRRAGDGAGGQLQLGQRRPSP